MNIFNRRNSIRVLEDVDSTNFLMDYFVPSIDLKFPEDIIHFLEYVFAVLLLLILTPFMAVIIVAVKVMSPGDAFYKQVRIGKNGREFEIYKFRSMVQNAELKTGAVLSSSDDSRVTPFGRFLRKSHIDELPQLLNVVKGDMSFIGPRPERPIFVNQFNKSIFDYSSRSSVKPGITGLAQISLPYDATASQKIIFDLMYINNRTSFFLNFLIITQTVKKMLLLPSYQGFINNLEIINNTNGYKHD